MHEANNVTIKFRGWTTLILKNILMSILAVLPCRVYVQKKIFFQGDL